MMEVALSEFHIPYQEFLFRWNLPRITLLFEARSIRNEAAEKKMNNSSNMNEAFETGGQPEGTL